ncbi:hypothetical protein VNI00_005421 [Paramarasmius palmivorus]|uniref:Peptidase A1 domain-containing protein n=1 Tax=Paramarasmius palmivorus TaxID=297713 RepID=A0AAW0DFA8_9AGAR
MLLQQNCVLQPRFPPYPAYQQFLTSLDCAELQMQSDLDYPRRIVVDDTDPRISYNGGPWTLDVGSFDNLGVWGAPYNHTSHGTSQNGASFSFTFEGEFVQVRGIKDNRFNNPMGKAIDDNITTLAKWTCQVDGGAMPVISYWSDYNAITDMVLCEQGRLSHDPHTVTVNVVIDDPNAQTFWVDRIEYTPLPNANLDNTLLKIDASDSSIRYDNTTGAWNAVDLWGNGTFEIGSSFSFQFNGTAASLYGFNEGSEEDWQGSSGRYYIDNSGDKIFSVEGSKRDPRSGRRSDFLNVLGNAQLNSSETTMGIMPTQSSDPNPSERSAKSPTGAIVGGVIGGVLVLVILISVLFFRWRKAKQDGQASVSSHFRQDDTSLGLFPPTIVRPESEYNPYDVHVGPSRGSAPTNTTPSQNLVGMKNAQRHVVAPEVTERQHQDSGIRYPQQRQVVDVPPNYTEQ